MNCIMNTKQTNRNIFTYTRSEVWKRSLSQVYFLEYYRPENESKLP